MPLLLLLCVPPAPQEYPKGSMISGAVLGHLTAMVNPVIFGWYWRRWFLSASTTDGGSGKELESV